MQLRNRFMSSHPFMAVLLIFIFTCTTGSILAADKYPSDAVVVRFSIDPLALSDINNTEELVDALHRELKLEAASPLDFEVVIHLVGNVYQGRDQQAHEVGSGTMVNIEKGKPVNDRIKDLRFYTYGDFSESEAWDYFKVQIQEAVLYSMNSSRAFEADETGTVWLNVAELADGETIIQPDGSKMVLELSADVLYRDGSKFGSKTPPEGYRQELKTFQIVLSPAEVQASPEAVPEKEAVAVVEEAETDGITAIYGYDESGLRIEKRDGQYVMSDIRKSPPVYMPLTSIGENYFSVEYAGVPAKLKFSVDDEGQAFAMSIEQEGHSVKLPRK